MTGFFLDGSKFPNFIFDPFLFNSEAVITTITDLDYPLTVDALQDIYSAEFTTNNYTAEIDQ
jgi:hypothetical protein